MISLWEKEFIVQYTDVTIVGAGFSGLWTAFFLKKISPSLSIQLLDKESFPNGASTRNAGFACFGSPSELLMNFANLGEEKTLFWALERWRGVQLIKKYFGEQINYENCGGYELLASDDLAGQCEAILPKLNDYFSDFVKNNQVYRLTPGSLTNFGLCGFKQAILNVEEGSLNSGKLLLALTEQLKKTGVEVIRGVRYVEHTELNGEVRILTSVGEIKTKHVCLATNAFSPERFGITPGRGQILLTKPMENIAFNGTFHVDKGYTYFRNVDNRVLIGGGRNLAMQEENTGQNAITEVIQDYLEKLLRERILPNQKFEVESRWSGIMGFTATHEPICELQGSQISVIAGMNGMGVALAPRLGEVLAGEIHNKLWG